MMEVDTRLDQIGFESWFDRHAPEKEFSALIAAWKGGNSQSPWTKFSDIQSQADNYKPVFPDRYIQELTKEYRKAEKYRKTALVQQRLRIAMRKPRDPNQSPFLQVEFNRLLSLRIDDGERTNMAVGTWFVWTDLNFVRCHPPDWQYSEEIEDTNPLMRRSPVALDGGSTTVDSTSLTVMSDRISDLESQIAQLRDILTSYISASDVTRSSIDPPEYSASVNP